MNKSSTYKNRLEFERINRDMRKQNLVCANCGSANCVELHHIVPLFQGGTNAPTNIAPLCYNCHRIAHNARTSARFYRKSEKAGRPKKMPPKGYEAVLDRYISGEIGTKEAFSLLGLSVKQLTFTQFWWYRDYLKSKGFETFSHINHIDVKESKRIRDAERANKEWIRFITNGRVTQ